ncbi:Activity-regulated cytoskeleton associated protein 1 [Frankliniella fusca]|uniref:Activity-regulated cytoskeleton associated protein 1 n=1 Tax=Frankliniella fusca TaxID=407009 RepID=A0AAE1LLD6_9NEOP|nr:Activity-regulated cytoskeleton associated protein 1 [Frankliniella fusca]
MVALREAVHTFRLAGEGVVYNASSVPFFSTVPPSHSSPKPEKPPKKEKANLKQVDFQKWGVTFSGAENVSVLSFILDAEEKAESSGIEKRYLYKGASEFFTGRAKTWYRTIKSSVSSWEELKNFLRAEFLPVDYCDNLWEEVRGRLQGEQEPIGCYIANMLSLFERLSLMGPIDEEVKLNIISKNLAPFYVKGLVNVKILSIPHLKMLGRDLENAKFRVERYDNSRRTPLMEPEFAYKGRQRRVLVHEVNVEEPEVAPLRTEPLRPRPRAFCWRCLTPGHIFRDCQAKGDFPLFCWGCGRKEVVKTNCPVCRERKDKKGGEENPPLNPPNPKKELQPQRSWSKTKFIQWLEAAKLPHDVDATRPELAAFAKLHARPIVLLAEDLLVSCILQIDI